MVSSKINHTDGQLTTAQAADIHDPLFHLKWLIFDNIAVFATCSTWVSTAKAGTKSYTHDNIGWSCDQHSPNPSNSSRVWGTWPSKLSSNCWAFFYELLIPIQSLARNMYNSISAQDIFKKAERQQTWCVVLFTAVLSSGLITWPQTRSSKIGKIKTQAWHLGRGNDFSTVLVFLTRPLSPSNSPFVSQPVDCFLFLYCLLELWYSSSVMICQSFPPLDQLLLQPSRLW